MIDNFKIAIIGYGPQGQAWAQNLRDSGCDIIVGLPTGSKSRRKAQEDKIRSLATVAGAVRQSDIIIFAFPDHLHGPIYKKDIRPNLKKSAALVFLCGFSIHFQTVRPSKNSDIILLAPLGPGQAVRKTYLNKGKIGFFHAIYQNGSGQAKKKLDSLILEMHLDKERLIKTTFAEEAIGDIFGEQAVLCGGLTQLIKAGYETLQESGLSSDKAYLEVAYQLDLIVNMIKRYGIEGMYRRISTAAKYGSYLSGPKIIDSSVKKRMKEILREIRSGDFAKKLNALTPEKIKKLDRNLKKMSTASFEKSARKLSGE
jgi:ketol-acid reductoisomerase